MATHPIPYTKIRDCPHKYSVKLRTQPQNTADRLSSGPLPDDCPCETIPECKGLLFRHAERNEHKKPIRITWPTTRSLAQLQCFGLGHGAGVEATFECLIIPVGPIWTTKALGSKNDLVELAGWLSPAEHLRLPSVREREKSHFGDDTFSFPCCLFSWIQDTLFVDGMEAPRILACRTIATQTGIGGGSKTGKDLGCLQLAGQKSLERPGGEGFGTVC